MSYTANEIFEQAIIIIDELSDTGAVIDSQVNEYKYRAPRLLDMWQKEIVKQSDLYKTVEVSCYRKTNLLGDLYSFEAVEHIDEDLTYETSGIDGANCFFFGVDGPAEVYIEEEISGVWTNVEGSYIDEQNATETAFTGVINADTTTSSYNYYKGTITPTSQTNKVRLRFSGDYYYRCNCRALCPYKYASVSKVPDFKPWYKIEMPTDFKDKSQVIDEYPDWQYEEASHHKWEGNNELYVQFGYEGTIRIKYRPIPAKITSLTQTLEVDEITSTSGAYYLAEHFAMADMNDELARRCRQKFEQLKVDYMVKAPLSPTQIKDVYGVGD